MVNEYRNSINLGRIKVSRNDLKLTDGTYKFSIEAFNEAKEDIESGWRLPTREEFRYIHSISYSLNGLGLARNGDYWLYGGPKPRPGLPGPLWDLYPCVEMTGDRMYFVDFANTKKLRIRLVKDL
jgi:hypothetical protein